ncbi:nose resistant to fluoxetine protein 6 [Drosophila bipectinata]|uniref:nose resistant to fluoxetine protein 6 n=1 Tax=Drosophila bipectinata TaxID=42026 RepID=UPI001C8A5851|nr:nose resistant to fluoxetine protein 6 isoform X1 [Drosophila bipectinata]
MVVAVGSLFIIGLAALGAAEVPGLTDYQQLKELNFYGFNSENSEAPTMADYQRLMKLRSLGMEFFHQFKNISTTEPQFLDELERADSSCILDMKQFMEDLTSAKFWAISMIDSWGTIPSGYLYGNRVDMGNYDQCLSVDRTVSESQNIKGKYCMMELPVAKWLGLNAPILSMINIKTALCFPSSCSPEFMENLVALVLKGLLGVSDPSSMFFINQESCKTKDDPPLSTTTIVTIALVSVFCVLAVLCTACDYFWCQNQSKIPRVVKVFSVRTNSKELFSVVDPKSTPNVIHCIHGLRCMSLIWVIVGHEYTDTVMSYTINRIKVLSWFRKPFSSFIIYAPFSVDTFLFITGLLLVVIGLRSLERAKGKLNIPMMYLHRYLRLTPIVAVAILVYMQLLPLISKGPVSQDLALFDYSVCSKSWYWNMLFVQNYAAVSEICLPHTWYLAVDMQLYILAPFLLLALYKWGAKAAGAVLVLMLLLSACLFTTIMTNDFKVTFLHGGQLPEVQKKLYFATHNHAAPWLVGTLFGYFMHRIRGAKVELKWQAVWAGWLLCLAMMFTAIFSMFKFNKLLAPSPTVLEGAFFYTLTRVGWPLAMCWVVFACVHGYGGMANSFLSSPMWQPLSRISYSAYIWHIFIQEVNHRRIRTSANFSDYDAMLNFWGCFGFTLVMSYAFYVTIEAPLAGLENLLLPSRKKPTKTRETEGQPQNKEDTQKIPSEDQNAILPEKIQPDLEQATATSIESRDNLQQSD